MTLKDELGFLYRDMIRHKMWNDLLAEKETNTEKKKFYKGEAYMAVSTASKIDSMVRNHFKDGNKDVTEWLEQAKKDFEENTKDLRRQVLNYLRFAEQFPDIPPGRSGEQVVQCGNYPPIKKYISYGKECDQL